jgi:HK97 family phage major capsid protein
MIGEAITELQANGWNPAVVILNPTNWGTIQCARGTSNDGYLMGSPRDPAPPALWSVPVITSASLAVGTAIVLDVSQVALLDRQEIIVATSREDGSNFTTNMVTVLAEGRMGLAVFSPGAVLSVALTPST